jgi:ribonuclease D
MIGIDVETTALRPAEGDLRLVQLSDGKRAKVYDAFRQDAEEIRRAVEREDELVGHNAVFEREWLNAALAVNRPDLYDTMIMSQIYYTGTRAALGRNFSHSLAAVAKRELKMEIDKEHQKNRRTARIRRQRRQGHAAAGGDAHAQDRQGQAQEDLRAREARLARDGRHGALRRGRP